MSRTKPKTFNFQKQLNLGKNGENLFIQKYNFWYSPKKGDGNNIDLILNNGKTVELKTDYYKIDATQNFFMERYGNLEKKTDGGPWKAQKAKIDYFVYLYLLDKTFYWFTTDRLVEKLNILIKKNKLKMKFIDNEAWTTAGYLIDRLDILEAAHKIDTF